MILQYSWICSHKFHRHASHVDVRPGPLDSAHNWPHCIYATCVLQWTGAMCWVRLLRWVNVVSHWVHWSRSAPCWERRCALICSPCVPSNGHSPHLMPPVWSISWLLRPLWLLNTFPHWHVNVGGLSECCVAICCLSLSLLDSFFPQSRHFTCFLSRLSIHSESRKRQTPC